MRWLSVRAGLMGGALLGGALAIVLRLERPSEKDQLLDNPLGSLIKDEVTRAETDYSTHRTRAQSILTVSGVLVTALAGLLALAAGREGHLQLSKATLIASALTLLFFISANVVVLIIFLPSDVEFPTPSDLATFADESWDAEGWDREVAKVLAAYLISLRRANDALAKKLALAIFFQILGVLGAASMALSLLDVA